MVANTLHNRAPSSRSTSVHRALGLQVCTEPMCAPSSRRTSAHRVFPCSVRTCAPGTRCTLGLRELGAHLFPGNSVHTCSPGTRCTLVPRELGAHLCPGSSVHTCAQGARCALVLQGLGAPHAHQYCTVVKQYDAHLWLLACPRSRRVMARPAQPEELTRQSGRNTGLHTLGVGGLWFLTSWDSSGVS